jgi:hypothetical protein
VFYARVGGVGRHAHIVLGGQAIEYFRYPGLAGLEGRSQIRHRPSIPGQAGQMVEDEELGIGQLAVLEDAIDPRNQSRLSIGPPENDFGKLSGTR